MAARAALPTKLRVGYRVLEVRRSCDIEDFGNFNNAAARILIAPDHPSLVDEADTLIHEILHAIWRNNELGKKCREERAVTVLTHGLIETLAENPALMLYLRRALAK